MNNVKGRRVGLGMSASAVASHLGMAVSNYLNRERGFTKFSDEEKISISKLFGWSPLEMNIYLYDGMLPIDEHNVWL